MYDDDDDDEFTSMWLKFRSQVATPKRYLSLTLS